MAVGKEKSEGSKIGGGKVKRGQAGGLEKFLPAMVALLVVMSFGLGSLWSKVKYLESGGGSSKTATPTGTEAQAAPAGKYATLGEALDIYAGQSGLDADKLAECVDSGKNQDKVDKDYQQGVELGVRGTPGFFVNGKFLGGAFPFEAFKEIIDRELAGTGSESYSDYQDSNLKSAGAAEPPAFVAKPVTIDLTGAVSRGPANAKVTIVEYSDFQCPYCTMAYGTLRQIMDAYGDKVRLVYKHYPLHQIHPLAQKTAEAWECAVEQNPEKAWKLHDLLRENQQEWARATL